MTSSCCSSLYPASLPHRAILQATKKHGITSVEARLAWEDVDDIENNGGAIHMEAVKATLEEEYGAASNAD